MLKMGLDRPAGLLLCAHCVFQSLFKASYLLFRAACRDKACLEFSNVLLEQSFVEFVQIKKLESFSFDKPTLAG